MHDSPDSGEWLAHAYKDYANRYEADANFNIKIGPGDEVRQYQAKNRQLHDLIILYSGCDVT